MSHESLLAGALGGLLWLDRFQICQFMVSRPIVSGPLVGWMAGDITAGTASGILFEFLWLRTPPVGGFIAPDVTLGAIATAAVSAGVAAATGTSLTSVVFLSFLVLLPLCFVGKGIDKLLRLGLGSIARRAEAAQRRGEDGIVRLYIAAGLVLGFFCAFLVLVPTIEGFTFLLTRVVRELPSPVCRSLGYGFYLVPLLGATEYLLGMEEPKFKVLFISGLVVAAAMGSMLVF